MKEKANEFINKAKNTKKPDGPDPFFTEWQRTSQQNPEKAYYKDLVKKMFLMTGGMMIMLLLVGDRRNQNRTVRPDVEQEYLEQQSKYAKAGNVTYTPNSQNGQLPHPRQQYAA